MTPQALVPERHAGLSKRSSKASKYSKDQSTNFRISLT